MSTFVGKLVESVFNAGMFCSCFLNFFKYTSSRYKFPPDIRKPLVLKLYSLFIEKIFLHVKEIKLPVFKVLITSISKRISFKKSWTELCKNFFYLENRNTNEFFVEYHKQKVL